MQQVRKAHAVVGAQIGRRRAQRVRAHNLDFLVEVGGGLEEDDRRHHLRDAGDRALVLGILFVEDLAGRRVVDDGGRGADVGHDVSGFVGAIPWRLRLGQGPGRPGRLGAGRADAGGAGASPGGGRRLLRGRGCGAGRSRSRLRDGRRDGGRACARGKKAYAQPQNGQAGERR